MNRSKYILLFHISLTMGVIFTFASAVVAQGIQFHKQETWAEIKAIALKENKLIFIDVYTDWCGPCKLMEEEVFSLPETGDFYNQHFVNYKFDAEKGEGITLKERFGVRVYPTYLFVDPVLDEVVHRSTSRQSTEVFLFTGQSALEEATRSEGMQSRYQSGDRDKDLLRDYAKYLHSCYKRDELRELVSDYFDTNPGLTDALAWDFFIHYQDGTSGAIFQRFVEQQDALRTVHGASSVNGKLKSAFEYDLSRILSSGIYNPDRFDSEAYQAVSNLLDQQTFEGKTIVLAKANVMNLLRTKQYDEAAEIADRFPEIAEMDEVLAFYQALYFPSRSIEDLSWMKHALKYVRFIAMNDLDNRAKAINHYNYALFLEKYMTLCEAENRVPDLEFLDEPRFGETRYTLRPPDLKAKPIR